MLMMLSREFVCWIERVVPPVSRTVRRLPVPGLCFFIWHESVRPCRSKP